MELDINRLNQKQVVISGIEDEKKQQTLLNLVTNFFKQLSHVYQYRELIRNLVIRDLKVRYKNSVLGIFWSLMNPLLMMLVFTVVFTVMAPVRSATLENFPVFVLSGLLPWQFFITSLVSSTLSIVNNAALIKKVYFPQEILPLSVILANLVNFLIALVMLFGIILVFRIQLTIWAFYLPLIIFIQIIFSLGMGLLLATVNVFYRDTQQILDVAVLAWFFMTPIFYPMDILPQSYQLPVLDLTLNVWRLMYIVNPMASLVATYRVVLMHGAPPALDFLARTAVTAGAIF